MNRVVVVLTTVPARALGVEIARALVDDRLAACASVSAPMTSVYRWKGTIEQDTECQLIIKTVSSQVEAVRARIGRLHPFELPEFLVLSVEGSAAYLDWVTTESDGPGAASTR